MRLLLQVKVGGMKSVIILEERLLSLCEISIHIDKLYRTGNLHLIYI